jgi:hypothetical protein
MKVGQLGPAYSLDCGYNWQWLGQQKEQDSFSWTFVESEKPVMFGMGMTYTQENFDRFIGQFMQSPHLEKEILCKSNNGRDVEKIRCGCIKKNPLYRVLLTCRHHCCEMMASFEIEGIIKSVLSGKEKWHSWLRENVEFIVIPFVDKDGVEQGDQGKSRFPHDHNRDYLGESIYEEVIAIKELCKNTEKLKIALDLHCPYIKGSEAQHKVYMVGCENSNFAKEQRVFGMILEKYSSGLPYKALNNLPFGHGWNTEKNYAQGSTFVRWAQNNIDSFKLVSSFETPYAESEGCEVNADSTRKFGQDIAASIHEYLNNL